MRTRLLLLFPLFFLLVAARQRAVTHPVAGPLDRVPEDHYSSAEPEKVRVHHLSLDLAVDFERKVVSGSATLLLHHLSDTRSLILDARSLDITSITVDGAPVTFTYERAAEKLTVPIEPASRAVTISYSSSPQANALHWIPAAQSFGRTRPYLFSQNEPDYARSWIPLQDTPTVRMTYDATLRVPPGMLALMSAENPTATNDSGVYTFRMPYPIPSYLVAIAVARLEFRPLDERSGVYMEPEMADDAQWELSYIPDMVDAAERVAGAYPFGRYDVLLMPPTYTIGGMEHPRLNFIAPFSVVTFNRPVRPTPTTLIAHELAHSWAGDQTTLGSWADVWLNEGMATYLAERILEQVHSPERAELNWYRARSSMESTARFTTIERTLLLHRPHVAGEPAIMAFNTAAYTKGALFLKMLEERTGREPFDAFLLEYFRRFAWRWVDERNFIDLLRERGLDDPALLVNEWIYEPTLPVNVSGPVSSTINDQVSEEARAFRFGAKISELNMTGWTDVELDIFFERSITSIRSRLAEVDAFLHLSDRPTPPLFWMIHGIETGYAPAMAGVERILTRGGSNGQVTLLYSVLARTPDTRAFARRMFDANRERYDASVIVQVEGMLKQAGV